MPGFFSARSTLSTSHSILNRYCGNSSFEPEDLQDDRGGVLAADRVVNVREPTLIGNESLDDEIVDLVALVHDLLDIASIRCHLDGMPCHLII